MGGRQDSLTAHAGPAHPPESPHVRSGPTSGGREPEEEAEGAGLALRLAAEVCSRPRVPDELEVRAAGAGARALRVGGCSDLGPREGREHGGGRAQARQGACCHCHSVSTALASSLGKVLGWIVAGTPCLLGHLRGATPARPCSRPARCPPSPARPGARGAEPITSARAWPASCSRSHGSSSREPRAASEPLPPPALRGKVTSRGSPSPETQRTIHTPFYGPWPLPLSCAGRNF